jgi:hypothetical protein
VDERDRLMFDLEEYCVRARKGGRERRRERRSMLPSISKNAMITSL